MKRKSHSFKAKESVSIFGSLSAGVDLMDGILQECEKHKIRSGKVSCIGSLQEVGYVLFQTVDGLPSGYGNEIEVKQPVELIHCTGFICEDENKDLDLHLHGLVTTEEGQMSGGHFVRGKNPTLITVEFSVTYGEEIQAARTFDQDLGFRVINFSK